MDEQKKYPESSAGAYKMVDIPMDEVADVQKGSVVIGPEKIIPVRIVKDGLFVGTTERKITETEGVYVSEDKKLSEILKEKGLNVAEDQVTALVHSLFEFVEIVARKTENKFDDALIGFLPQLKEVVLEKVDEIDGKVG